MEIGAFDNPKIRKTIIHIGQRYKPISPGAKVIFHFLTRKCDDSETVIDDSRKLGKPMELVIGKKFKLEVWETIVQAMAIGEVASFKVDKSLVYYYPIVSKTLRDANNPNHKTRSHVCAHSLHTQGIGFPDLDDLFKNPTDLEFIIELLNVENQGEYEKDSWQFSDEDKLKEVPKLKEEGNRLIRAGKPNEALEVYGKAIAFVDQLMLCEKPGDVEWNELNEIKLPILLNYALCKLTMKEYYSVIEHCNTVLRFQPENIKALYRRGQAHMEVWNVDEAKEDLEKVIKLNPSLRNIVRQQLRNLEIKCRQKESDIMENIKGKLF